MNKRRSKVRDDVGEVGRREGGRGGELEKQG